MIKSRKGFWNEVGWMIFGGFILILIVSNYIENTPSNPQEKLDTSRFESEIAKINNNGIIVKQNIEQRQGIFDEANRLKDMYGDKGNLVTEIQERCDAQGPFVTRSCYVEWRLRNNEFIEAGERLSTYITENFVVLNDGDAKWVANTISLLATNKERMERDNQALEQRINTEEKGYQEELGADRDYYTKENSLVVDGECILDRSLGNYRYVSCNNFGYELDYTENRWINDTKYVR